MYRVISLLAPLMLALCLISHVSASDLTFVGASNIKPAALLNFDGSHHLDISHNKQKQEQKQDESKDDSLTFDKAPEDSFPLGPVCAVAAVLAIAGGVAIQWNQIAKTVTAVH